MFFNLRSFQKYLIAGFVSALAAFPVSIGLALIAGVPPAAMVAASIYAGFFGALFSSKYGVGGPNAATAVMTGVALRPFAPPESSLYMGYVLTLCLLIGLYQLLFAALLRKVNLLDYISTTVVDGLIYGVGITFVMSSLWMTFGLAQPGGFQWTAFHALMSLDRILDGSASSSALGIAGATLLTGILMMFYKASKRYAVLGGMVMGCIASLFVSGPFEQVGWVAPTLFMPSIPDLRQVSWPVVFNLAGGPALAIALVSTLQSLTAVKTIRDSEEPFTPVKETANQGMQQLFMAFFSCAPVAISYNKSTLMQSLGGSHVSHIFASLFTLVLVYALGSYMALLPMGAMGGALILVGFGMMGFEKYRRHSKFGFSRKMLFVVPAAATIVLDVQTAVFLGIGISVITHISTLSSMQISVSRVGALITVKLTGVLFYLSGARLERLVRKELEAADMLGLHDDEKIVLDFTNVQIVALDHIGLEWVKGLQVPTKIRVRPSQEPKLSSVLKRESLAEVISVELAIRHTDSGLKPANNIIY